MTDVEQVDTDLFIVKHEVRPNWFCSVSVIFGKNNIGLIDTGFEDTIKEMVFPLIKEQGRNPNEVTIVVNTHRDGDHIKGNPVIREHTDAVFAAHRLEIEAIPNIDQVLEDGDAVKVGDRNFKVIHTPGHRPGAICLLEEETGLLLTDDVVCGTREDLIRMGKEIYIESLRKLEKLDIDTMIMSHPFQPAGKAVLRGEEVLEMLDASIKIAENL